MSQAEELSPGRIAALSFSGSVLGSAAVYNNLPLAFAAAAALTVLVGRSHFSNRATPQRPETAPKAAAQPAQKL